MSDPVRIRSGAEGMCLRCGENEGDWHIAWLGAFNIICTDCFRTILEDRDQAALRDQLAAARDIIRDFRDSWLIVSDGVDVAHMDPPMEKAEALLAALAASGGDSKLTRGDKPRGWDETTPPCPRCGRIVCMCPAGDETRVSR